MAQILVDRAHWPVVLITIRGDVAPEDMEAVVKASHLSCERHQRFLNLFDLTQMGDAGALARKYFIDDAKAGASLYGKWLIAAVCVVPSRIARGVLTAMQWVFRFPHPVDMVADRAAAVAKARRYLEAENIPWPAALTAKAPEA